VTAVPDRLTTALADRYRIERELGQGGMATVYLAEDLKHGRRIALKVMQPELAAAIGPDRFLREIRTTANLRHPHIVPLFDSGDADGLLWYAMPFVEGESLQARLAREGQLGLDAALRIGREVAGALGYAHGRGVIHRDIKPGNILLEAGHAVVADFGIASAVSVAGGEKLTQTGMIVGSPAYMSPEQASGSESPDARSDLYSLGCVIYEMLAGQPPFTAPTAMVVMAKHMLDPVPPIATARPGLPGHVTRAVERLLTKAPADRYPSAEDWIAALEEGAGDETTVSGGSAVRAAEGFWIAVLPFRHRGSGPGLEALAEGLTEDIVTGLSRFSYLKVVARSTAARFMGDSVDVRVAGRELGARYIMEGSLRQAGPTLRMSVQLVDTESGTHLWAEHYDRTFAPEDLFSVQDDIGSRIVSTVADMNGVLPHTMSEALRHRDPQTLTPYEMVLRGFGYVARLTPDEHAIVRDGLERAVAQAPQSADVWSMLAFVYAEEHKHDFNQRPDPLGRSLDAARRAVAIAPSSHLGYHMLAQAYFFRGEFRAFRNAADRAVLLNPLDAGTLAFMGILMAYAGDWDHGCSLADRAMQLNPHHPGWYRFASFNRALLNGEWEEARDVALRFNMPSYYYTHMALAAAYGMLGDQVGASRALRELRTAKPNIAAEFWGEIGKWMSEDLVAAWAEGLRRAGLDVGAGPGAETAETKETGTPPNATAPSDAHGRPEPIIVVLPFVNRSPDPDNDWFSDGLTEEIITDLSRIGALRVISRNSSMALKGTATSSPALAREIGVTHVVTGSVRRAGDDLRVTAELVDAPTDRPVWSDKFAGTVEDVFGIQEEIAGKIVAALEVTLTPSERKQAAERPITNPVAYDCYLRARQAMYEWTPEAGRRGHAMADDAIAIVGETPLLLATKALLHWNDVNTNRIPANTGLARASDLVERALSIESDFALAIYVRGLVAGLRGRVEDALPDLYRAHEQWPGDVNILYETCRFSSAGGLRHHGDLVERVIKIDPLTPVAWLVESTWATVTGQHDRVPASVRRAVERAPAPSMLHVISGWQMVEAGEAEEGCAILSRAGETLGESPIGAWALFLKYAWEENSEAAFAVMTPGVADVMDRNEFSARTVAQGYALLGQTDDALRWLRTAVTGGFINYPHLTEYDPLLAGIRGEPGFREIAEQLAKPRWERVIAWEDAWRAEHR